MVPNGYTHTGSDIKEEEHPEKEPIPAISPEVVRHRSYGKKGSKNEKPTRHPFHPVEWYIFKHVKIVYARWVKLRTLKALKIVRTKKAKCAVFAKIR